MPYLLTGNAILVLVHACAICLPCGSFGFAVVVVCDGITVCDGIVRVKKRPRTVK